MPTLAAALTHLPTVLFWLFVVLLVFSEMVGFFWRSIRWRFRRYACIAIMMLAAWWAAEYSHQIELTSPDFHPWTQLTAVQQPSQ